LAPVARKAGKPIVEAGEFHGDVEPGDWRVVARSDSSPIRPPGRRLPWGPTAKAVAKGVANDVGPLVRAYIGIVLYRAGAEEAEDAAAALRRSLAARLKEPAEIRIERWNEEMDAWQPPELWATADVRELQVIGTVRCESKDAAAALAVSLRARGQLFLRHQGRRVIVGTSGEAQAQALLAPYGEVGVSRISGLARGPVVGSLVYDRRSNVRKGGWLAYDPSGY
jgi:hypothetical protein